MTRKSNIGFTLVEMILVIVIIGIIGAMTSVFVKPAIDSYFSTVSRAVLTDEADSALRFVARDMRAALPNSIVCTGGGAQFLQTRSAGRYREHPASDATGVPLQFGNSVTGFDTIGSGATSTSADAYGNSITAASNKVVVGNLSSGVASCNSNYSSFTSNAGTLSALAAGSVTLSSGTTFPVPCDLESATNTNGNNREFGRFYIVNSTPITYVCDTTSGLTRNGTLLVDPSHVSACAMVCDSTKPRIQEITLSLGLKDKNNETISLLRRLTIVNRP